MTWNNARVPNSAGTVASRFAHVSETFAQNFADGHELGAAFAVYLDGNLVVDICGGHTDRKKEQPWTDETITCLYSTGKAVLSFLMALAVEAGDISYDEPVARYWPDFGAAGKDKITVAELLSHQAGLCGIAEEMPPQEWLDWDAICARLAAMAPLWSPGSANGYHPQTVGFMAGEILRRVTGQSVGDLVRSHARDLDLSIFCGMDEAQISRAAYMAKPPKAPDLGELNDFTKFAFLSRWSAPSGVPKEDWMAAQVPGSNMHGDARSLAGIVHPIANNGQDISGKKVLSSQTINRALTERIRGDDLVLPFHLSWSAGLMKNINGHFGPNSEAFGHGGFGGASVLIDREYRLTAAYVMNKMSPYLVGDPRSVALINAVYDCL